jgi:hypothetical protein
MTGKRRRRTLVAAALVLLVAFVGVTARLFVFPDLNTPVHSDAIVVLGGHGDRQIQAGEALARGGIAPLLVFSLVYGESCLRSTVKFHVVCFKANPLSTQGEARAIVRLALKYHLSQIIVVVPTAQATRARLRIGRCYTGRVLMDGVNSHGIWEWGTRITYEWPALIKALVLQPDC